MGCSVCQCSGIKPTLMNATRSPAMVHQDTPPNMAAQVVRPSLHDRPNWVTSNTEAQAARGLNPLLASCVESCSSVRITGLCVSPNVSEAAPSFITTWAKTSTTAGYQAILAQSGLLSAVCQSGSPGIGTMQQQQPVCPSGSIGAPRSRHNHFPWGIPEFIQNN